MQVRKPSQRGAELLPVPNVLVRLSFYFKKTRPGGSNSKNIFLITLKAGGSRSRWQPFWFVVKILFLVCRQIPLCCVLTQWRRDHLFLSFLVGAWIPFIRGSLTWPNYLLKAPSHLGVRLQHMNWGGTYFQSIAPRYEEVQNWSSGPDLKESTCEYPAFGLQSLEAHSWEWGQIQIQI